MIPSFFCQGNRINHNSNGYNCRKDCHQQEQTYHEERGMMSEDRDSQPKKNNILSSSAVFRRTKAYVRAAKILEAKRLGVRSKFITAPDVIHRALEVFMEIYDFEEYERLKAEEEDLD